MTIKSQTGVYYGCDCGEVFPTLKQFRQHMAKNVSLPPEERHHSRGRVTADGQPVMPPYKQRTREQKRESIYSIGKVTYEQPSQPVAYREEEDVEGEAEGEQEPATGEQQEGKAGKKPQRITQSAAGALEVRLVPRVVQMDFSPIMRSAIEAAHTEWGWPLDNIGDLFDTIFYHFFLDRGIRLQAYIIEEKEEDNGNGSKGLLGTERENGFVSTRP